MHFWEKCNFLFYAHIKVSFDSYLLNLEQSPHVWKQTFIAKYYNKHCSQDLTGPKPIIVQQLSYNTQYGM